MGNRNRARMLQSDEHFAEQRPIGLSPQCVTAEGRWSSNALNEVQRNWLRYLGTPWEQGWGVAQRGKGRERNRGSYKCVCAHPSCLARQCG